MIDVKKIVLLSSLICLALSAGLILQSYMVRPVSLQLENVGFFTHVEEDSIIYIMNIDTDNALTINIIFLSPDGTTIKTLILEDVIPFTCTYIEVSRYVEKKFDGMVLINSDRPFIATLQIKDLCEIQIMSEKYLDIIS